MKHIKSFEQINEELTNEGFVDAVKKVVGWIAGKPIWKVNFTAELINKKSEEPASYRSYVTVKAKDEEDAAEKFHEKWVEATKKLEKEPRVIVGTIKKTGTADKMNISLPRTFKQ